MSETPITDSLRQFRSEGLNDGAMSQLCKMALDELMSSMPEEFFRGNDGEWMHIPKRGITIATSHEPYYRETDSIE